MSKLSFRDQVSLSPPTLTDDIISNAQEGEIRWWARLTGIPTLHWEEMTLTIRFSPEDASFIRSVATAAQITYPDTVRMMVNDYLRTGGQRSE